MTKLYAMPNVPTHWVVEHAGEMFLVPAVANGWTLRQELPRQHRLRLTEMPLAVFGRGLGLPL